ncbi:MAG: tetratricopeptide repeat protein, partial [Dehalococcoidia bacterium]
MKIKRALPLLMMMGLVAQPALADKKLDEAVDKAQKQLEKGKPADARKTLEKLASKQSTSPDAHVALCLLYQRLGELDAAMASAQAAAAASASATPALRAEAYATLASLDLRMGSGADALAHATEAQKAQPTALALATLARAHARVGANSAALEAAEKAVAADANSMPAHEAMGEALAELGKGEEAIAAFRKALEVGVSLSCTLCNTNVVELAKIRLAATLLGEGKTAEAVILAQEASESDPQLGEAFAVLGTATLADDPKNSAKWSEAIGHAQQGAFVDARNPLVRMAVAGIFEAAGNIQQAEAAYKMALQADPAYTPARAALVHAQLRRNDLDGAL